MPSHSGLRDDEIFQLVEYFALKREPVAKWPEVGKLITNRRETNSGAGTYAARCIICHGEKGEGDAAKAINNASFLRVASNEILYQMLVQGRMAAGMPSWYHLSPRELSALIQHIRSWGAYETGYPVILPDGNPANGDIPFHYRCSRCHGEFGEGDTGPAIINPSFLSAVDDRFLYRTISSGREHTAMFGWETPMVGADRPDRQEIADIIAYMRALAGRGTDYIYPGAGKGDPTAGMELFATSCSECHGQTGEGPLAPALNNQEFLNAATNGYLLATISMGRKGTPMPAWGQGDEKYKALPAQERHNIVSFIRQWQRILIKK
jgi:mono/diheme cytochrome c family protein